MTTGVLVMAYGTPRTPADVEAYYTRIRHGRAPSAEQLADLVRRYDAIGGTSPLAARTAEQVTGLREALARAGGDYEVVFGAKYEPPLIEDAAATLLSAGVSRVVGLVLAPHESSMSTAQYHERAAAALGDLAYVPIGAWWDRPAFLELVAQRVRDALTALPAGLSAHTEVIFSAHSLPSRILEGGDTYPEQLRESARAVAQLSGVTRWDVAFQSAGRTSDPWLGPDITEVLRAAPTRGVRAVVSCPIGFVADHLEVLYDLDVEAAAVAAQAGLAFVRTASLNDDPRFCALLAELVRAA
jgi:ferrochelatase